MKKPFSHIPKLPKRPEPGPRRVGLTPEQMADYNRRNGGPDAPPPGISPERREAFRKAWDGIDKGNAP